MQNKSICLFISIGLSSILSHPTCNGCTTTMQSLLGYRVLRRQIYAKKHNTCKRICFANTNGHKWTTNLSLIIRLPRCDSRISLFFRIANADIHGFRIANAEERGITRKGRDGSRCRSSCGRGQRSSGPTLGSSSHLGSSYRHVAHEKSLI